MTMDDRAKRIVDTAVMLAERDGYQAVRLRDVAATAQVALGTVYKRFASKEEILIAALEQLTGNAVVLNTSLNRRGEPMVCSPQDALNMFFGSDLEYLVMEDFLVTKVAGDG